MKSYQHEWPSFASCSRVLEARFWWYFEIAEFTCSTVDRTIAAAAVATLAASPRKRALEAKAAGFRVPVAPRISLLHLRDRMRALSSQVRYAICGIFDLAYNADMKPVQLRVIGERQNIPPRYLEQIFQRLRRAGLVAGKRGPGGGYTLLRGTAEITLRDVVEAVEGPIDGGAKRAARRRQAEGSVPLVGEPADSIGTPSFLWQDLAERISELLAETTIEDLCQESVRRGVPRATAQYLTYQI